MTLEVIIKEEMAGEDLFAANLTRFASEAAVQMNYSSQEMEEAVRRACYLCAAAGIAVRKHFRPVYLCTENSVICDWQLSELGYYLVCLNGDGQNPNVAALQLTLLKQLKKV